MTTSLQTFDSFLRDEHAKGYHGTDDDMPDAFEAWFSSLDAGDVAGFAEEYGSLIEARTLERVKSLIPGRSWIVLKDTDTEHVEVENVEYNRCRAKVLEALSSLQRPPSEHAGQPRKDRRDYQETY